MIYDICISGAGIVGRTLALLLAQQGLRVGLVTRKNVNSSDTRTHDIRAYALNASSCQTLRNTGIHIGVDTSVEAQPNHTSKDAVQLTDTESTAVRAMEISDQTSTRAKTLRLHAQPGSALAWIVDVPALQDQLYAACTQSTNIQTLDTPCSAPLQIVCEGKPSRAHPAFGFAPNPYHQVAIAARLHADVPHQQVAHQWFSDGAVLALLPLHGAQGADWALVWSIAQEQAKDLLALDEGAFIQGIQDITQGAVGRLSLGSQRQHWPLHAGCAAQWVAQQAQQTYVLAGDAAHSVHPLAGQGLNLGLADAALLAQNLAARSNTRDYWRPLYDPKPLRSYARERMAAAQAMIGVCDGLQQLFAIQNPVIQNLRQSGLGVFQALPWLQNQAMRFASR